MEVAFRTFYVCTYRQTLGYFSFFRHFVPCINPKLSTTWKAGFEIHSQGWTRHVSFAEPALAGRQLLVSSVHGCGTWAAWKLSLGRVRSYYTHKNEMLLPREEVLLSSLTISLPLTSPAPAHLITTLFDELDESFDLIKTQRGNPNLTKKKKKEKGAPARSNWNTGARMGHAQRQSRQWCCCLCPQPPLHQVIMWNGILRSLGFWCPLPISVNETVLASPTWTTAAFSFHFTFVF